MTHRVIAQRVRGDGAGEFLDWDVPVDDISITDVLSGPCRVTGKIPMAFQHLKAWDDMPIFSEWDCRLLVEEDGEIIGQGTIVDTTQNNGEVDLDCAGFSFYAKGQPYLGDYSQIGLDPADGFRHIGEHLQDHPDSQLNIVVDSTTTDRRIGVAPDPESNSTSYENGPYTLNWWETHDLGSSMDELAKIGPFDYHEKTRWVIPNETLEDRIEIGHPRLGRRRNDLSFSVGTNVTAHPTIKRAGDQYATALLVLGAGEGREMVRALVDSGASGRLRRVAVLSDRALQTVEQASDRGREELARRLILNDFSQITVSQHKDAPIGSWDLGDEIPVQVITDWIDTVVWVRILSSTIQPGKMDAATLSVERVERFA